MSKLKLILRELLVFVFTVSILPISVLFVLSRQHSLQGVLSGAFREMIFGSIYSDRGPAELWVRLLAPYLFVQALRAWHWSQKSIAARRWAHLYLSVLFFGVCYWSLSAAWDLFYFMYALGDIPAEIGQFLNLRGSELLLGIGALILALHSLSIFFNPEQRRHEPH